MVSEELREEDPLAYKNFLRMSEDNFKYLLELIRGDITKEDTVMRESIPAENRQAYSFKKISIFNIFIKDLCISINLYYFFQVISNSKIFSYWRNV